MPPSHGFKDCPVHPSGTLVGKVTPRGAQQHLDGHPDSLPMSHLLDHKYLSTGKTWLILQEKSCTGANHP